MNHSVWMFAATYPEWLNWIAVGRIRCNGRVTRLNGAEDKDGFSLLLDRAPDISIDDDQAYIIAKLKPNFRNFQQDVLSATSQELTWLLLEAVDEFIPVSDRGARLIEADSQRAKVKIGVPIFQNSWKYWTLTQKSVRADCRGRNLVKVMGLGEPDLNVIPNKIIDYLDGRSPLPNAEKASDLRATMAFAWASSFAIFGEFVGDEEKRKQTQILGLSELIQKLRHNFAVREAVLKDEDLKEIGVKLSKVIKSSKDIEVSLLQLAVCFHYSDLINSGKEIFLSSLVKDIGEVVIECGAIAGANTAYFIGKYMDDIAVSSLVYSSTPLAFQSLIQQKLPDSIDVGKYVTERQIEIAIHHENMLKAKLDSEKKDQLVQEDSSGKVVIASESTQQISTDKPSVVSEVVAIVADPASSQALQQAEEQVVIDKPAELSSKPLDGTQTSQATELQTPQVTDSVQTKPKEQINEGLFDNVSTEGPPEIIKPAAKAGNTRRKKVK